MPKNKLSNVDKFWLASKINNRYIREMRTIFLSKGEDNNGIEFKTSK